ncbi:hypothetical protein R1flu_022900 [Riccia fluitans]|uniref:Uncharacterized protein n=1 Tax=Riccia fluitans TaxID=41844 RepID=A0ABD1XR76_9MARC
MQVRRSKKLKELARYYDGKEKSSCRLPPRTPKTPENRVLGMQATLDLISSNASAPEEQHQQNIPLAPPSSISTKEKKAWCKSEPSEYYAKYTKYRHEFERRLNHKYFSGKKNEGRSRVFTAVSMVDGFTMKESSQPPIESFLDQSSFKEERQTESQTGGSRPVLLKHGNY